MERINYRMGGRQVGGERGYREMKREEGEWKE
jgi:hypothetical protein